MRFRRHRRPQLPARTRCQEGQGYGQSKTANIYMANEIERRYGSSGLHALSLHPGMVLAAALSRNMTPDQIQAFESSPEAQAQKNCRAGGGNYAVASTGRGVEGRGGLLLQDCRIARPRASNNTAATQDGYASWAYDKEAAQRLWVDSQEMVTMSSAD